MNKAAIFLPVFTFLFIVPALAQLSIKAEVDKTTLTSGSVLTYKLTITSLEESVAQPQLPNFSGFNVVSSAQSSTVSLAAGNAKTIIVYAFVLAPVTTGKIKIEPSSIKANKETLSTQAFEIEVKKGKAMPKANQEQKPSIPEEAKPEETEQSSQITL